MLCNFSSLWSNSLGPSITSVIFCLWCLLGKRVPLHEILDGQRRTTKRNQVAGGHLKKDLERETCVFNLRGDETLIQIINLWWVDFWGREGAQDSAQQNNWEQIEFCREGKGCDKTCKRKISFEWEVLVFRIVSNDSNRDPTILNSLLTLLYITVVSRL